MEDVQKYEASYRSKFHPDNHNHACLIETHIKFVAAEAIHRYYESRRRQVNDCKENRTAQVSLNKRKSKRRAAQKQARLITHSLSVPSCVTLLCIIIIVMTISCIVYCIPETGI